MAYVSTLVFQCSSAAYSPDLTTFDYFVSTAEGARQFATIVDDEGGMQKLFAKLDASQYTVGILCKFSAYYIFFHNFYT